MSKYFMESERYKLEVLLKEKYKVKVIARILDKSVATIYNEIKRGTVELKDTHLRTYKVYKADVAQNRYLEVRQHKGVKNVKLAKNKEFEEYIENKIIKEKYSPCAALASAHGKFQITVCFKTLYNYIHNNKFKKLRDKHLTVRKKKNCKKFARSNSYKNLNARLIDRRSEYANKRLEFGHWEMDTVLSGHGSKAALLVLTERKARLELIYKLKGKTQKEISGVLDNIEQLIGYEQFKKTFKTITMDNGTEFLDMDSIERSCTIHGSLRTVTYYCHPFCSSERGSNENANKLIRRFAPKGSDLSKLSKKKVKEIQDWINDYPRKIFNYMSSNEVLKKEGIKIPSVLL